MRKGIIAAFVLAALAAFAALAPARAQQSAGCQTPRIAATWINDDARVKEVSSIEIEHFCPSSSTFGEWRARLKTRCHPRDCTWGWTTAKQTDPTTLRASFQGFYTTIFLTMRFSAGSLLVEMESHTQNDSASVSHYRLERKD